VEPHCHNHAAPSSGVDNSLDGCEALANRIGIMVNGELKCLGTASHLKAVHGHGYELDLAFEPGADLRSAHAGIWALIQKMLPGSRCLEGEVSATAKDEAFRQRMKFQIPKSIMPISALFGLIEREQAALQISEYSISETTLDRLFLNFAKQQDDDIELQGEPQPVEDEVARNEELSGYGLDSSV